MNRVAIAFGYAWYSLLWGPTVYDARLNRMNVRLGAVASLDHEAEDVKEVYGTIVRREQRYYVGFCRLAKKMGSRLGFSWPGSRNMLRGERAWLESNGLLTAVLAQVGEVQS